MWGAIIGAGASIFGNYLQRYAQEDAMRRQQALLDSEKSRETALYNRRYYEDATQRADTQRMLTKARETLLRQNRAASGRAAVMGGTNAQAAAEKEANNKAYADIVSSVAASAEDRKDKVEDNYMTRMAALDNRQATLDAANDQANVAAIGNMASQVGALAASAEKNSASKPVKPTSSAGAGTSVVVPDVTGANAQAAATTQSPLMSGSATQIAQQQVQSGIDSLHANNTNYYLNPISNTPTAQRMKGYARPASQQYQTKWPWLQ